MWEWFKAKRRRIRSKSVLLSSYRRNIRDWDFWFLWQIAQGLIPVTIIGILHVAVTPVPWFGFLVFIIMTGWMAFVAWNAWTAFRRLHQRRLAFLQASGVECDLSLSSLLTSREAWKASLAGKTMRDVLDGPPLISSDNFERL